MGEDNLYQISIRNNRIYGISENGDVVICYRQSDKLFAPVKTKHMKDSDDESDAMSDDEGMLSKYRTKIVKIKPFNEVADDVDATNMSIIAGSDHEDNHAHDSDDHPHKPLSSLHSPVEGCFFRTLETIDDYVAIVAHDGNGNNYIYVYNASLDLLADKKITIKKTDFSINTSTQILPRCLPAQAAVIEERVEVVDLRHKP